MGSLEDFATLLAIGQGQEAKIAADDPYLSFKQAPDSISDVVIKASANPDYSTKDKVIAGLLSGLTSGVFQGLSNDYQGRAKDAYSDVIFKSLSGQNPERPSVLSPSIFSDAKEQGSIFAIKKLLAEQDLKNEITKTIAIDDARNQNDIKKELLKISLTDPSPTARQNAARLFESLGEKKLPIASPAASSPDVSTPSDSPLSSLLGNTGATSGVNRLAELEAKHGDYEVAKNIYEKELEQGLKNKFWWNNIPAADQQKISQMDGVLKELNDLSARFAKYPGGIVDYQSKKLIAGTEANDLYTDMLRMVPLGARLMSEVGNLAEGEQERQIQTTLGNVTSGPEDIALRIKKLSDVGNTIGMSKLEAYRTGSINGGDALIEQFKNRNSPKLKETPTPNELSPTPSMEETPEDRTFADALKEGLSNVPETIENLVTRVIGGAMEGQEVGTKVGSPLIGAGLGVGRNLFGFDQGLEEGLKGVGRTAAGVGGAVLGSPGGFAGMAGGATAGGLAFDKALEFASELAGVGTEAEVIPTREDLLNSTSELATIAGTGGVLKGAGVAARGTGKVMSAVGEAPKAVAGEIKNILSGIRGKDIVKDVKEGKYKYFDESGVEVPAGTTGQLSTALEQSVKVLEKDGFFKEVKNNPRATQQAFDVKLDKAGQTLSTLHAEAEAAIKAKFESLSPIQKKQYPLEWNPKTKKGGIEVDLSPVKDAIARIKKSDAHLEPVLIKRLERQIGEWDKTKKTYRDLQEFKHDIGTATKWKPPSTEVADAWNGIKVELYKAFAKTQNEVFRKVLPEKANALTEANAKYYSYKNIEPLIATRIGEGRIPELGLGIFKDLATKTYPASALRGAEKLDSAFGPVRGAGSVFESAGSAVKKTAPTSSIFGLSRDEKKKMSDKNSPISDDILDALRKVESSDGKFLESKAGAKGPYQFMPATAKAYGLKDPFDETTSRAAARKLLEDEYKALGSIELALASYNLGRPKLLKAIQKAGSKDWDKVQKALSEMGIEETANYVPKFKKLGVLT